MKTICNQFIKNFSEIVPLQERSSILYNLIEIKEFPEKWFGIEIIYLSERENIVESISHLSHSKKSICDIITYLYENSVRVDNWKDIVADLFGEQIQRLE